MSDRPVIVWNPRRRFGAPTINGGVVYTWVVGPYIGGDSIESVCEDYGCTRDEFFHACWYAARFDPEYERPWATWLAWLEANWVDVMWPDQLPAEVEWPPQQTWPYVKRTEARRDRVLA